MTHYDRACRGWSPEDGAPLFDTYPVAVAAILGFPVLLATELAMLATVVI